MYDEDAIRSVANAIGTPLKVELPLKNRARYNECRALVELDVSKAMLDKVWIAFEEEDDTKEMGQDGFWQGILYGEKPSYCTHCLHLGHMQGKCKLLKTSNEPLVGVRKIIKNLKDDLTTTLDNVQQPKEDQEVHKEEIPRIKSTVLGSISREERNGNKNCDQKDEEGMIEALKLANEGVELAMFEDLAYSDRDEGVEVALLGSKSAPISPRDRAKGQEDGFIQVINKKGGKKVYKAVEKAGSNTLCNLSK